MMPEVKPVLLSGTKLLCNRTASDVFAIDICVNFGSALEKKPGIAHFIEHMFFSGTRRFSRKEIASRIDSVGGILNAFTSREYTHYYIKVKAEHYKLAIDTLFECLNNCEFFPKELELERRIILNEIKDMQDTPVKYAISEFTKLCLPGAFGRAIIGNEKSVLRLKRGDLLKEFKRTHCKSNIMLSIAGPKDVSSYAKRIAFHLESLREGKRLKLKKCKAKPKRKEKLIERDVKQAHLCIGFPAVSSAEHGYAAFSLIEAILGGGLSSRIVYEVREKRGLSYVVDPFLEAEPKHGLFGVYLTTRPEKVNKAKDIIIKELEKLREGKITAKELKRAKNYIMGTKTLEWEDSFELAKDSAFAECSGWTWKDYIKTIKELGVKELRDVAQELIPSEEFCMVAIMPRH